MFKKHIVTFAMIASLAAATSVAIPAPHAEAKDGRKKAFIAGAITLLAAGAIASHAIKQGHRSRNHHGNRPHHYRPKPWSNAWYDHCFSRYQSFNPKTGYFLGFDGKHHFCR